MMNLKIVVAGTGLEKSKFCETLSDDGWHRISGKETALINGYWNFEIDEQNLLQFLTLPDARRYDFMWDEFDTNSIIGYIVTLDSVSTIEFSRAISIANTLPAYYPLPLVIAVTKQDVEGAWDVEALRIVLRIPPEIPIIPCVATDKKSVANVLIALCEEVLRDIEADGAEA
jgi:uncharacterized protein